MAQGMIVAPQPEAVEAGAVVLQGGGNAETTQTRRQEPAQDLIPRTNDKGP